MVALKGKSIEAFVRNRPQDVKAVLLYGPDAGLVRERATLLAKAVVSDLKDPFNYIELVDSDVRAEPSLLLDEAAALSFAGGERVIRLRTTGDAAATPAKSLVDALENGSLKANALVLIEGGDLSKRSKLRKIFEDNKKVAALPCYEDGIADVRALAEKVAQSEGLSFDPDALDLLVSLLGEDRGITRSEIDKLMLFAGPKGLNGDAKARKITVSDVSSCLVDTISDAMDAVAAAVTDGDTKRLALNLHRSKGAGASPIGLLRAMQRNIARLQAAHAFVSTGSSPADAMKRLRPPVFYQEQRAFAARLKRWNLQRLEQANALLVAAELAAKSTGAPQQELIERAAIQIALLSKY